MWIKNEEGHFYNMAQAEAIYLEQRVGKFDLKARFPLVGTVIIKTFELLTREEVETKRDAFINFLNAGNGTSTPVQWDWE